MGDILHKKTIGGGLLAIDIQTGHILLGRRGLKGKCPNCWAPFGGTFEAFDGNPKVTAQREFKEESGCSAPYKISKSPFYINKENHLIFYTYLGLFDGKCNVTISNESLGYGWFPLDNLPHNLLPGFEELINNKRKELESLIGQFKIEKEKIKA